MGIVLEKDIFIFDLVINTNEKYGNNERKHGENMKEKKENRKKTFTEKLLTRLVECYIMLRHDV